MYFNVVQCIVVSSSVTDLPKTLYLNLLSHINKQSQARRRGGGGGGGGVRGGSPLEPPFWPPKDFIYTAIVHFKCPTGPLVSLLLRITAVQASLVAVMRVCS